MAPYWAGAGSKGPSNGASLGTIRQEEWRKRGRRIVEYGGLIVECRDESDAKKLAASLRRKKYPYCMTARTADGVTPSWRIDCDEGDDWLSRR
jgi:hypothetical protein